MTLLSVELYMFPRNSPGIVYGADTYTGSFHLWPVMSGWTEVEAEGVVAESELAFKLSAIQQQFRKNCWGLI